MKSLTLYPEHAELFRLGIRTIETRGWKTPYRGGLALIAGKRDPDSAAARRDPLSRAALDAIPHGDPLPLGAVVAVCDLIDIVPMHDTCTEPIPDDLLYVTVDGKALYRQRVLGDPSIRTNVKNTDLTDQLPFGDFTPGRYAWLLDNARPVDPIPCKGFQGLRDCPVAVS